MPSLNATRSKHVISIFLSGFLSLAVCTLCCLSWLWAALPRCRGNQEQAPVKTIATAQSNQFLGVLGTHWGQLKCYNESSTQSSKSLVLHTGLHQTNTQSKKQKQKSRVEHVNRVKGTSGELVAFHIAAINFYWDLGTFSGVLKTFNR